MASSAIRAVAATASSRRRTISIPASWIAQESLSNEEMTSSAFSKFRPRGSSLGVVHLGPSNEAEEPADAERRAHDATRRSSRRRTLSSRAGDDAVFEEEGQQAAAPVRVAKDPTERDQKQEVENVQFEYTRLLPHRGKRRSRVADYGSSGSSSSLDDGNDNDDESNTSDVVAENDSSETTSEGQGGSGSGFKFNRQQWIVLIVLMTATLTSSFAVCLFPPFYPRLAEEKGSSAAIYGFVIGTNCLASFLVTPVIGKNLPNFGVLYSLVLGTFIGGMCCAISGFLEFFPPGWCFVTTSVLIRVLHAAGNALVITSTFTYAAVEFQQAVGQIFSLTRTAMNLGQLLGPLVGGALYQYGGFYLPFVTMGALQAAMGLVSIVAMKEIPASQSESSDNSHVMAGKKVSISSILRIPTIWFSFGSFVVATICNGFLSINLEPKVLRPFHLSPFWIGLLFGIKDGANSLSSPVWGYLCDKNRKTSVKPYLIISAFLVAASFVLMGAGSVCGITFDMSLGLLIFVLCLNGIGIGGEQVAGVVDALHETANAGYPDDPGLHGIIAGLWSSLSGAGRFVSRVGSGILVDCIGFDATAAIVTFLQAAVGSLTFVYMVFCECSLKRNASVHWDSVIDNSRTKLVFTEATSPSDCLMSKTVSVEIPKRSKRFASSSRAARSCPYQRKRTGVAPSGGRKSMARSLAPEMMK